jgi:hypothetical protein
MMQVAGLSVAYHAKPRVRNEAKVAITEGGLTACWKCCLKPAAGAGAGRCTAPQSKLRPFCGLAFPAGPGLFYNA